MRQILDQIVCKLRYSVGWSVSCFCIRGQLMNGGEKSPLLGWPNICVCNKVIYDVSNANDYMYVTFTMYLCCVSSVGQWPYPLSIARDQVFILRAQNVMFEWSGMEYVHVIHPFRICHHYYQMLLYLHTTFIPPTSLWCAQPTTISLIFGPCVFFSLRFFPLLFLFRLISPSLSLCSTFTYKLLNTENYCTYVCVWIYPYISFFVLSFFWYVVLRLLTHFPHL